MEGLLEVGLFSPNTRGSNQTDCMGENRGFVPCFLRAFPANAVALVAFEGVMRNLP